MEYKNPTINFFCLFGHLIFLFLAMQMVCKDNFTAGILNLVWNFIFCIWNINQIIIKIK